MRSGWHRYAGSARLGQVGVGVEVLPDGAWLTLVRKLCSTRPGWCWCEGPAK